MSQQKEIGTLVVVVLKAQHLHQPSFYKQNPYAQATLSGVTKRTKVDPKGGQHPVWDDEFRFPVLADVGKDKSNRILEVACYKDEQRGDDVLLGKGTVDIEETLKTGEFDDWVSLETSAGARGEIYLEMTFYANSLPSVTRRPSKLSPSDRVARPAAYFNQGRQLSPKSTSPNTSPRPGRSPVGGEKKPVQPSQTSGTVPASLTPARGPQSQPSRQALPTSGGNSSVIPVKQRDDPLPPLPEDEASSDVGSGRKSGLPPPLALQPGGGGPRPVPPRNRVASTSHPPPEIHPGQPPKRTLSDTPVVNTAVPPQTLPSQNPMQYYTTRTPSMAGTTPSIVLEESIEDQPRIAFPIPFSPPPGPTQDNESRGIYATGNHNSFTYGFAGQIQAPPNSHTYAATQTYPQTVSPSQRPNPMLPGQPQQHYDSGPASPYLPYTQHPNAPSTPFSPPPMSPQSHSTTSQPPLQQSQYPLQQQPYPSQQQYAPHQQPYSPPPSLHQYHPQQVPYSQAWHPLQVSQPYQQYSHLSPPSSPVPIPLPQQTPLYTQAPQKQHFAVPAPPQVVQSQTQQPRAPQQSQQHFSIPPPPPPPPPSSLQYNQGGKGHSTPNPVAQPPPTPIPPSMSSPAPISPATPLPQSISPVVTSSQPLTTPTLLSQVVPNTAPAPSTEEVVRQRQVEEERNEVQPVIVAGSVQNDLTETQVAAEENKQAARERQALVDDVKNTEAQEACETSDCGQRMEEEARQRREQELRRQDEEQLKEREAERRKQEEDERREREEEKRNEERRKMEEERVRREEEEYRKREEEELRRREEQRAQVEEMHRRRREEECRRLEEEEHRRMEEERIRREEQERQRREEGERRRKEEERIQQEHEEAERRRQAAEEAARRRRIEEAEAERKWQEELARIRARTEQEAADAAFARAQMDADEEERRRQEEADLTLVRQAQEEAEREERLAQERVLQEEADMEVARREQAHEEELERRRREERRKRMEEADRELARRLDMELNLGAESSNSSASDRSRQRPRAEQNRRH